MTTKAFVRKSLIALGSLGLVSLATVEDASARGTGAAVGRPVDGSNEFCFDNFFVGVRNLCSSVQ